MDRSPVRTVPDESSTTVRLADTVSELLYSVSSLLLLLLGLVTGVASVAFFVSGSEPALLAGTLTLLASLLFLASAVVCTAWFRERFGRRGPVTQFGHVRSVDERVVRPAEQCSEPCVVCSGAVERGLVRRSREEFTVAGVPLHTRAATLNHYCLACARQERSVGAVDTDPEHERTTASAER
jgi:hypothetical protein